MIGDTKYLESRMLVDGSLHSTFDVLGLMYSKIHFKEASQGPLVKSKKRRVSHVHSSGPDVHAVDS